MDTLQGGGNGGILFKGASTSVHTGVILSTHLQHLQLGHKSWPAQIAVIVQ